MIYTTKNMKYGQNQKENYIGVLVKVNPTMYAKNNVNW